jgi:signal transduction histidine kinase
MELFRKYKTTTSKIEKNQLRYVFLAGLIAVTIGALNIFLSLGMKVYPFGSLGYVAFSGIIAYAIVKHQLMDIRVIIKQSIVYATLTLFITVFYAILVAVFHGILGISLHGSASWILNAFAALIIAATFQPLRTNIQFMVDRLFFRDKYNYKTTLMDFSNALSSEIELNRLLNMILEKVTSTMHIDRGAIMLLDKNKDEYIVGVSGNIDRSSLGDFSFDKSSDLYKWLNSGRRIFNIEEERFYFKQSGLPANEKDIAAFEKILNIFEKHGIQLAVPLFVRDKLTGVFDLGRKMNEDSYSQEDLEFLTTVANQSAIAIENASLYSDIRQLEKSLYHSDKLASLGALSASMVHEIRTPITSIKSFCQMIPRMYNNPGFCNKYEVTVNRELDRLNEILERLLNFSKPIGDNDRTDKIVNIINEILLLLDKEIEKNRVKVIIEYGTSTADVMLPSDGLKQVLMNIIMNAVHAMPDGGKIRIGLEREGFEGNGSKLLKLEIEDTGIGIPKENIDKIFNAFFTTKEKGTGLGMSVSKKIINELNGNIGVASEVGKGTVFTIRLPIKTPGKLGSGLDM